MTIGKIWDLILYISNKEKSGNIISPDQFNILIEDVNLDLLDEAVRALGVSQEVTDILMPFKVRAGLIFLSGAADLPSDYVRFLTIYDPVAGVPIEILEDTEIGDRLNNPITAPTTDYPVVYFVNNQINILPTTTNTITGTAGADGSSTTLKRKTGTNFTTSGIKVRSLIRNTTDGSWAEVVAIVNDDTITTTTLQGGTDNTWQTDDGYSVGIEMHYIRKPIQPVFVYITDSLDHIRSLDNSHILAELAVTSAGTPPQTYTLKVTYGGVDTELIDYTTEVGATKQSIAEALADQISVSETGYYAEVGVEKFTIYHNQAAGVGANYTLTEGGSFASNVTLPSPANFSDGTGGSVELEWIYHGRFVKELLERVGISLKDQQIQAYAGELKNK